MTKLKAFQYAKPGGYAVLVGFHFATREVRNWVWATFWWHNFPNQGPYAEDRPRTLKGVWRNYLMAASYDMVRPREADGKPHIAYNPYLEGQFWDGVTSKPHDMPSAGKLAGWRQFRY